MGCTVKNATAAMKMNFVLNVNCAMNVGWNQGITVRNVMRMVTTGVISAEKEHIAQNVHRNTFVNSARCVRRAVELSFVMNADFVQNAAGKMQRVKTAAAENIASKAQTGKNIFVQTVAYVLMKMNNAKPVSTA